MNIVLSDEQVGKTKLKVQRFRDANAFETTLLKEEQVARIEELSTRIALMKQSGLVSAARAEEGTLAFYRYCMNNSLAQQEIDFGAKLLDSQLEAIISLFPNAYQWGWHTRYGSMADYHKTRYGRAETADWQYHLNGKNVGYKGVCWETFNFGTIPTSVLKKIHSLQNDPIVEQMAIFAPKESVTDPILIVECYNIGRRIVARWGEALAPIKGLDC